jgi:glycerophosphoryl diester phosphodiesterase
MQSPARRKVESLLRDEVRVAQEVLALQQKDNYRYQEHVKILDAEIDSLRKLLEEKQNVINMQNEVIIRKDDSIKQLEQELYDNRIEKHAFKTFEHQNVLLLEELRATKAQMEELEVEVRFLRDLKDQRVDYDESKMKMVAEMDIMLNGHRYEYKES